MENKKINTALGTIILCTISVSIIVIVWKYDKNLNVPQKPQPISNIKRSTTNQVSTKDQQNEVALKNEVWQSYVDDKFSYAVKYPQGYKIQKYNPPCNSQLNNQGGQNVIVQLTDTSDSHDDYVNEHRVVNFDIFINDPNDKCVTNAYSSIAGPAAQKPKLLKTETLIINEQPVLKRTYAHLAPDGNPSEFSFSTWRFRKNSNYYTLLYNNGVPIRYSKIQNNLFSKFISSFRFTNY